MFQLDVVLSLPKSFPVLPAKKVLHHFNYIQIKILKSVIPLTWAPPDHQFSALDHYNDHCCSGFQGPSTTLQPVNHQKGSLNTNFKMRRHWSSSRRIKVVLLWYGHTLYTVLRQTLNCPMADSMSIWIMILLRKVRTWLNQQYL